MKQKLLIGLIVLIVLAAGGFIVFSALHKDADTSQDSQSKAVNDLSSQLEKACSVFGEETAKTLLGESATKANDSNEAPSSSDDIAVSQCSYIDSSDTTKISEQQKRANLIVRVSRTDTGRQNNQSIFDVSSRPAGAVEVLGYGDKAFWNPEFGQLNILKNGDWYVLEYGSVVPTNRNQADTERFAALVKNNL